MPHPSDPGALEVRLGRPGAVTFASSDLGGTVARLSVGANTATVALQGAQVLDWKSAGRDVLWFSPVARLGTGKPVRGGIPICWPWFGSHPTDAAKPSHGFVRTRPWEVVDSSGGSGSASVTLEYRVGETDRMIWPRDATARLTVTLDAGLNLALETINHGEAPLELTQALHTYFAVGDIEQARVEGLDGLEYMDKTIGYARRRQQRAVTIAGEVDRIYLGKTDALAIVDHASARRVDIRSSGSRSAVVWNPWAARTAELGDMGGPDAYKRMLCLETANAGDDCVNLAPVARHTLAVRYTVEQA